MVPLFQSQENIVGEVITDIFLVVFLILKVTQRCSFGNVVIETGIESYYFCIQFQVVIEPVQGKKVEHNGVKIELLGQIGVLNLLPVLIFRSCILYLEDHVHVVMVILSFLN